MSGLEIVGVVFGVLPLLSSVTKPAAGGIKDYFRGLYPSQWRKETQNFLKELSWETHQLQLTLQKLFQALPDISEDLRARIVEDRTGSWANDAQIQDGLLFVFNKSKLEVFLITMNEVLTLLSQIVDDGSTRLSKSKSKDPDCLQVILQNFIKDYNNKPPKSTYWERIKFLQKKKNRDGCLASLKKWNKRLEKVIDQSVSHSTLGPDRTCHNQLPQQSSAVGDNPPEYTPSERTRILARRMFSALSRCWPCLCPTLHHDPVAKVCLENCTNAIRQDPPKLDGRLEFVILVQHLLPELNVRKRYETKVSIQSKPWSNEIKNDATVDWTESRLCSRVERHSSGVAYSLEIWDYEKYQMVKPPVFSLPKYKNLQGEPMTLRQLLENSANKSPPAFSLRKELALTLAISLFQLYQSSLPSSYWSKDCIQFFPEGDFGNPDLKHPYIDASFQPDPLVQEQPDPHLMHRNIGIMKLGILLIEIHLWKPIEAYRTDEDLVNGVATVNTDLVAAMRAFQDRLGRCGSDYKSALASCLEVDWCTTENEISLENQETREAVYREIVQPLQREVDIIQPRGALENLSFLAENAKRATSF